MLPFFAVNFILCFQGYIWGEGEGLQSSSVKWIYSWVMLTGHQHSSAQACRAHHLHMEDNTERD